MSPYHNEREAACCQNAKKEEQCLRVSVGTTFVVVDVPVPCAEEPHERTNDQHNTQAARDPGVFEKEKAIQLAERRSYLNGPNCGGED